MIFFEPYFSSKLEKYDSNGDKVIFFVNSSHLLLLDHLSHFIDIRTNITTHEHTGDVTKWLCHFLYHINVINNT